MYMKQTGNRADVFTTSLLLVLEKEVFIRANSFKTCLWISFAFLWYYAEVEKNGILLKKQIAGTFLYMGQLFSVVSLFSKIKWNSFQFQTLLLLFRLVGRLVKINYVKSYEFTSEDQQTVAQLKDFTEKKTKLEQLGSTLNKLESIVLNPFA